MRPTTYEVSRQLCEDAARLIRDGWHPLLSCFKSMRLVIEGALPMVLSSTSLEASSAPDHPTDSQLEADCLDEKNGYDLTVVMNGASIGTFSVVEREGLFNRSDFLAHLDQAARLRLNENPDALIPSAQCLLDTHGEVVWMNGTMTEVARISPELFRDLMDQTFDNPVSSSEGTLQVTELEIHQCHMLAVKIPIRSVEEGLMHFVILSDNAQDPKSAVIKEIHHRVKNNLQTIASLLRLQMRRVNSKKVENAFNESINRISSIALIHEELSRGGIDKINIKSATANIMEMVLSSMVPPGKNITGELSGSEIYQDADKASSLSLCITELIQNSVEHAFQMRKKGVIKVDISEVEGEAVITISDNGIGFGGKKNRNSLGLEIIEMITVEKLKGTFVINGQINGTTSVIRFPLKS
ncbi:sensor histidine kinase [Acidaminobacter sp.]|uniref:sensor histidine kinase n=1 Tax=Acidaminobacter sp. TaxID=1872102 RepID=UPI002567D26B|nr:sensor histidine kinase [Acidaminobacter sp.]MDK9712124.1 sensor histidine kinase [Acidaminobacter sp.]